MAAVPPHLDAHFRQTVAQAFARGQEQSRREILAGLGALNALMGGLVKKAADPSEGEPRDDHGRWTTGGGRQHLEMQTGPVGFPVRAAGGHFPADAPRHIVSDALEDDGRAEEAHKMRYHPGPVAMDVAGKIRRGVMSHLPVERALNDLNTHLTEWSGGEHPHFEAEFNPENHGDYVDIDDGTPIRTSSPPPGHVRVHLPHAGYLDGNPVLHTVPYDQLGRHIAASIEQHLDEDAFGPQATAEDIGISDEANQIPARNSHRRLNALLDGDALDDFQLGDAESQASAHAEREEEAADQLSEANEGEDSDEEGHHRHLADLYRTVAFAINRHRNQMSEQHTRHGAHFDRLMDRLMTVRPVIADPDDTDEYHKAFNRNQPRDRGRFASAGKGKKRKGKPKKSSLGQTLTHAATAYGKYALAAGAVTGVASVATHIAAHHLRKRAVAAAPKGPPQLTPEGHAAFDQAIREHHERGVRRLARNAVPIAATAGMVGGMAASRYVRSFPADRAVAVAASLDPQHKSLYRVGRMAGQLGRRIAGAVATGAKELGRGVMASNRPVPVAKPVQRATRVPTVMPMGAPGTRLAKPAPAAPVAKPLPTAKPIPTASPVMRRAVAVAKVLPNRAALPTAKPLPMGKPVSAAPAPMLTPRKQATAAMPAKTAPAPAPAPPPSASRPGQMTPPPQSGGQTGGALRAVPQATLLPKKPLPKAFSKAWLSSDHPRGNPKNKGQFTAKRGGKKKPSANGKANGKPAKNTGFNWGHAATIGGSVLGVLGTAAAIARHLDTIHSTAKRLAPQGKPDAAPPAPPPAPPETHPDAHRDGETGVGVPGYPQAPPSSAATPSATLTAPPLSPAASARREARLKERAEMVDRTVGRLRAFHDLPPGPSKDDHWQVLHDLLHRGHTAAERAEIAKRLGVDPPDTDAKQQAFHLLASLGIWRSPAPAADHDPYAAHAERLRALAHDPDAALAELDAHDMRKLPRVARELGAEVVHDDAPHNADDDSDKSRRKRLRRAAVQAGIARELATTGFRLPTGASAEWQEGRGLPRRLLGRSLPPHYFAAVVKRAYEAGDAERMSDLIADAGRGVHGPKVKELVQKEVLDPDHSSLHHRIAEAVQQLRAKKAFRVRKSEDEPRDSHGRWTSGGGHHRDGGELDHHLLAAMLPPNAHDQGMSHGYDRLPSLVFADHLDETGRHAHANFIRESIAQHEERGEHPDNAVLSGRIRRPLSTELSPDRVSTRVGAYQHPFRPGHWVARVSWDRPHPIHPNRVFTVMHQAVVPTEHMPHMIRALEEEGADVRDAADTYSAHERPRD